MKISEKHKKWLTKRAFFNCIKISVGILLISVFYDLAQKAFYTKLSSPYRLFYIWFALILIATGLWILGLLFPEFMETVFNMLGLKEKEEL